MGQTMKIEDRVKATMEELAGILGERRSEDDRYSEDAGIGEIPMKNAQDALTGTAAGDEQSGTISPPKVQAMKAEGVDDKPDDEKVGEASSDFVKIGDVLKATHAFDSKNGVYIHKGDRFKVHALKGLGSNDLITVVPLSGGYKENMIIVAPDSMLPEGKEEDAYESVMKEVAGIIGERRSADVRAAEDEPIGNVPGLVKMTGADQGYIPWKTGESVAVTVPATPTATESLLRASIQGDVVEGKVKVRIESETHPLRGRVMEWPASLVKRLG